MAYSREELIEIAQECFNNIKKKELEKEKEKETAKELLRLQKAKLRELLRLQKAKCKKINNQKKM